MLNHYKQWTSSDISILVSLPIKLAATTLKRTEGACRAKLYSLKGTSIKDYDKRKHNGKVSRKQKELLIKQEEESRNRINTTALLPLLPSEVFPPSVSVAEEPVYTDFWDNFHSKIKSLFTSHERV